MHHGSRTPIRPLAMNNSSLHQAIIGFFLAHQRAPTGAELASHFRCDQAQVRSALKALADDHGVVLHPTSDEIWVAHPFSAAPTTCVVRSDRCAWWGNCVWCSLGLAHLAGGTATIETRLGAMDELVTVRLVNGKILDKDFVVHFPIPMQQAWNNVVYTCSVMLLFRDESQVGAWCASRGIPKGDVRPIEQIGNFAAEWYARHADPNWTKWSVAEAAAMFHRHGLTGPVWAMPVEAGRF